ncbi:hypothetical protein COCVIDRAFT_17310 [Bipolaris victoriae FI3]|uniref:Uncharacterized protein n=1 Tax=Bipolaris victoriae (strain FI3) TaxID=930091 RepID=W7EBB4_BIPV3|nr:hypothetical protein COCVIDRAFT_17310 [Bipolaris victoriae FI3]
MGLSRHKGDGDSSPHVPVVVDEEGRRRACCNSPKQYGVVSSPALADIPFFLTPGANGHVVFKAQDAKGGVRRFFTQSLAKLPRRFHPASGGSVMPMAMPMV